MTMPRTSPFLRWVLLTDAAVSGASGLLMTFIAGPLASLLNVPEALLFYAGLVLFPYAAFVAYLAHREVVLRSAVWAAIVLNVLWARWDARAADLSGCGRPLRPARAGCRLSRVAHHSSR